MDDRTLTDLERRLAKLEREAVRFRKGQVTATAPLEARLGASDTSQTANTVSGTVMTENDSVAALATPSDLLVLGKIVDEPTGVSLTSTSEWLEQRYLTDVSPFAASNNSLGNSVAITSDGSRVVVGAPNLDILAQTNEGGAAVFVRSGTEWTREVIATYSISAGAGYLLGYSVAINDAGDTMVLGSYVQNESRVFTRSGTTWTEQANLAKPAASVAISENGNTVALGDISGSVTVHLRTGTSWALQTTISSVGGDSVALSADGNTLAIGDVDGNSNKGQVRIYTRSGSTWTLQGTLTDSSGATGDALGSSVALSDDGNTLVAGAPSDDISSSSNQGSAIIYTRASTTWTQGTRLTYSAGAANDAFGTSVSINGAGTRIVVGQQNDDIGLNTDRGSLVVYDYSGSVWDETTTLTAASGAGGDKLGYSCAISDDGEYIIGGAPFDDVSTYTDHGSASVFALTTTTAAGVTVGDGTVTEAKLANNAVTSAKIKDGEIVNADINASAAIALSKLASDPLARANHTGTQTASTISDFDTQVRTNRLDQMAAPTASVSLNSQKITSLLDPTSAQDAATKTYVDTAAAAGVTFGTPGTIAPDDSAAAGSNSTAARSDHRHAITTDTASSLTGLSNAEGINNTFARSDHTHAIDLPRVRAYASGAQSTTSGTDISPILYDSEDFDVGGFHSTVSNTGRLTVPSGYGGVYYIHADINWASNATGVRFILLYLNGTGGTLIGGASQPATSGFATRQTYSVLYPLAATDYVILIGRQNSGGSLNISATSFSMFRIGS